MYKLSKRSLSRLENVNPILIAIVVDSIRESPYDFGIPQHGGKRTADEQNLLFKDGKSQLDGFKKKLYHQSGNAFDIFGYRDGHATWDATVLERLARHIQKIALEQYDVKLTWGGDWISFKDMPHFQI